MFENPNDLATALNLLLPFAVALTVISKGLARLFFLCCAAQAWANPSCSRN